MRMTTKTRLAITAMLEIAMSDKCVKVSELADMEGVSESYMETIFKSLREAGLVEGARGPGGGYRLGLSAHDIRIAHIILAVTPESIATRVRPAVDAYLDFNARLWDFMTGVSLAECVERHKRAAA